MKVVAVIPVKGREPLLKHTIRRLYEKNQVHKVICIGDSEKDVCESNGAEFIRFNNEPLGAKWNTGFVEARKYSPDACLFVGSSDWVSDNWLPTFMPLTSMCDLIGVPDFCMLDIQKELRFCHWLGYEGSRANEPIGIGRLIHARILKKMGWKPFDDGLNNSMDNSMFNRANQLKARTALIRTDQTTALSISTGLWESKHKFEEHWNDRVLGKTLKPDNWMELIDKNFPEYKELHAELYK